MIEYLAYDFGLILFTRFKVFKKYRDAMTFKSFFLFALITIVVLIMSIITVLNKNTFLGLNTTNPVVRRIVLMLYLGTKATLFAYLVSDYFREKSDSKVPIEGIKGNRGLRGSSGEQAEKCDITKCKLNVCDEKILNHVTEVYSDILKSRNKKGSKHYPLTNHFIKNKIKTLCRSPQLEKVLEKTDEKKIYAYIKNIWTKWITIILKYENGEYFMETDYLTDNDFDNLIETKDKLYNSSFDNNNPGTVSSGKETPFDELKKYDMWYWGEPEAAKVKIVYKCDLDSDSDSESEPDVENKKYNINVKPATYYEQKWRSSVALQTKTNDTYTPFQPKGNRVTIYRPKTINNDGDIFYPLGDIIVDEDNVEPKSNDTLLVSGDIVHPIDFTKKYGFQRNEGIGEGVVGYSFWEPKAPDGYTCIGNAIENTYNQLPPNPTDFACVPTKCTQPISNFTNVIDREVLSKWSYTGDDNDNIGPDKLTELYSYKNLMEYDINNDKNVLIPEDQPGSCINNTSILDNNKGKWVVEDKNSEKYSIHTHFKKKK